MAFEYDPDEWPAYCALCDRGYNPIDASHFCRACNRALDEQDKTNPEGAT
jgi:hypothetical protein